MNVQRHSTEHILFFCGEIKNWLKSVFLNKPNLNNWIWRHHLKYFTFDSKLGEEKRKQTQNQYFLSKYLNFASRITNSLKYCEIIQTNCYLTIFSSISLFWIISHLRFSSIDWLSENNSTIKFALKCTHINQAHTEAANPSITSIGRDFFRCFLHDESLCNSLMCSFDQ